MRKYILVTLIVILIVASGVHKIQSQTKENQYKTQNINIDQPIQPIRPTNLDIIKLSMITGWSIETSTYFVEEANSRGVKVFEEALPIASIESGNTYRFDLIHYNTNRTTDQGLFQINDVLYSTIVKSLKKEGREFKSWDRFNQEFNIAAGILWIDYLKSEHQLEGHRLFSSYNKGVYGARQYASRCGTYETEYSRKVYVIKNELLK